MPAARPSRSSSPPDKPVTYLPSPRSWPACGVPRRRGRPRTRPDVVLADKARSSRAIREHLRERGIRAVIPVPADQRGHRLRRGSRGGSLRPRAYEQRNTVERCIRNTSST
ncbi:hypothetical protein D4104_30490 [Streptomyces alfalfae]|nr:hypothetical protein D3X13_01720 [Streptomyces fradiae]RZM85912.1 hypothetical protein D4104_30490 [Streptomyces alfalfae]